MQKRPLTKFSKPDTHYEIVGDTLVQHVNASATGTPVVAFREFTVVARVRAKREAARQAATTA